MHFELKITFSLQFAIWHLWDYSTILSCVGDDWWGGGHRPHVFLTLGATVSFCQRLCVITDANNVGNWQDPQIFTGRTPTLFCQHDCGRRNNSSQGMTTEKTTSSCQSRPTSHNYSQLINLRIRHVIQQTFLQKHRLQSSHFTSGCYRLFPRLPFINANIYNNEQRQTDV